MTAHEQMVRNEQIKLLASGLNTCAGLLISGALAIPWFLFMYDRPVPWGAAAAAIVAGLAAHAAGYWLLGRLRAT